MDENSIPYDWLIILEGYNTNDPVKINESNEHKFTILSPSQSSSPNSKTNFYKSLWGIPSLTSIDTNIIPYSYTSISGNSRKRKDPRSPEREKQKIEGILTQLKIPKTDVLTLERLINLEFIAFIHIMVVVLLPQELSKLEVNLNLPNHAIGEHFTTKLSPYQWKRGLRDVRTL